LSILNYQLFRPAGVIANQPAGWCGNPFSFAVQSTVLPLAAGNADFYADVSCFFNINTVFFLIMLAFPNFLQ